MSLIIIISCTTVHDGYCQVGPMPDDGFYSDELILLTDNMLTIDSDDRPSVQEILQSPLLTSTARRCAEAFIET